MLSCNQCTTLAQLNVHIHVSLPLKYTVWLCRRDHECGLFSGVISPFLFLLPLNSYFSVGKVLQYVCVCVYIYMCVCVCVLVCGVYQFLLIHQPEVCILLKFCTRADLHLQDVFIFTILFITLQDTSDHERLLRPHFCAAYAAEKRFSPHCPAQVCCVVGADSSVTCRCKL